MRFRTNISNIITDKRVYSCKTSVNHTQNLKAIGQIAAFILSRCFFFYFEIQYALCFQFQTLAYYKWEFISSSLIIITAIIRWASLSNYATCYNKTAAYAPKSHYCFNQESVLHNFLVHDR